MCLIIMSLNGPETYNGSLLPEESIPLLSTDWSDLNPPLQSPLPGAGRQVP